MSRVIIVRHGQASFGAADYDNLSPTGIEQSRILGASLASRGPAPDLIVAGEMRRHGQTAQGVLEGAGWDHEVALDAGWNEFDHRHVLAAHANPESREGETEKQAFQRWFEEATARWTAGGHDAEYDESFAAFGARVDAALARIIEQLPRSGTALVLTSGGPMAWIATSLLSGGADLWLRLNPVSVNTGFSVVVRGARGSTLVTYNDHSHLPTDQITYR